MSGPTVDAYVRTYVGRYACIQVGSIRGSYWLDMRSLGVVVSGIFASVAFLPIILDKAIKKALCRE
jgi:hypothetical protein